MAENSKIQWTKHTFNPWIGCTKVNEGCKFCYAENQMDKRYGRVKWGPDGTRDRTSVANWRLPLKWQREAAATGEIHKVFCASLADIFEADRPELHEWRWDLFELIDKCPNLYWLLLTKRPERIRELWPFGGVRQNIWLGTSIATQKNADQFLPRLYEARHLCPVMFVSLEPQISAVTLDPYLSWISWVIQGGESKQGKETPRRFDIEWARFTKGECQRANVAYFLKQMGSNPWCGDKPIRFRDSHGGDIDEWPDDLRVRQCPDNFVYRRKALVTA